MAIGHDVVKGNVEPVRRVYHFLVGCISEIIFIYQAFDDNRYHLTLS